MRPPRTGRRLLPGDEAGLKAILGSALPEHSEGFAEPVALAVEAVSDALDGVSLSRDDLHEALRQRLPDALLPWCPGCKSHHARRGLLVLAGLHGRLCIAGRAGRQPVFARTDQLVGWDAPERSGAGAELVRRYHRTLRPVDAHAVRRVGRDRQGARARAVAARRRRRGGRARPPRRRAAARARRPGAARPRSRGAAAGSGAAQAGLGGGRWSGDRARRRRAGRALAGAQAGQAAGRHGRRVREAAAGRAARPKPSGWHRTAAAPASRSTTER